MKTTFFLICLLSFPLLGQRNNLQYQEPQCIALENGLPRQQWFYQHSQWPYVYNIGLRNEMSSFGGDPIMLFDSNQKIYQSDTYKWEYGTESDGSKIYMRTTSINQYENEASFTSTNKVASKKILIEGRQLYMTDFKIDPNNNVIIIGSVFGGAYFSKNSNLYPQQYVSTGSGQYSREYTFIAKYNANFELVDIKLTSPSFQFSSPTALEIDQNGNYFVGFNIKYQRVDPLLPQPIINSSEILKFNSNLTFLSSKTLVGTISDISLDNLGGVYITGSIYAGSGNWNIILNKYNENFELVWKKEIGSSGNDYGKRVISLNGFVHLIGEFSGTINLGSAKSPKPMTSVGGTNICLARYLLSGEYESSTQIGGQKSVTFRDAAVDESSLYKSIYITGDFTSNLTKPQTLNWKGKNDAFIARFNNQMSCDLLGSIGTSDEQSASKILISKTGGVYLTLLSDKSFDLNIDPKVDQPYTFTPLSTGFGNGYFWKGFLVKFQCLKCSEMPIPSIQTDNSLCVTGYENLYVSTGNYLPEYVWSTGSTSSSIFITTPGN